MGSLRRILRGRKQPEGQRAPFNARVVLVALAGAVSTWLSAAAGFGELPKLSQLLTMAGAGAMAGIGALLAAMTNKKKSFKAIKPFPGS